MDRIERIKTGDGLEPVRPAVLSPFEREEQREEREQRRRRAGKATAADGAASRSASGTARPADPGQEPPRRLDVRA